MGVYVPSTIAITLATSQFPNSKCYFCPLKAYMVWNRGILKDHLFLYVFGGELRLQGDALLLVPPIKETCLAGIQGCPFLWLSHNYQNNLPRQVHLASSLPVFRRQ